MTNKKDIRIQWVDRVKGVAIILVVFGHVLTNGMSAGILTHKGADLWVKFIYSFHMPVFFFISGYLQSMESEMSVRLLCQKLKRNLMDLIIPYIIFAYAYLIIKMMFGATSAVVNQVSLFDFIMVLFIPVGEYWFLYALILFTLVAFVLKLICYVGKKLPINKVYLYGAVALVSTVIYFCMKNISSTIGIIRSSHQAVYYFAGMFASILREHGNFKLQVWGIWKKCVLIGILLILYGIKFILGVNYAFIDLAIAFLMILFLIVILAEKGEVFATLGKNSLPIYLIHVFIIVLCRIVFQKFEIMNIHVYILITTIISIVIPYVAYRYIIVKKKWLLFWIKPSSAIKRYVNNK